MIADKDENIAIALFSEKISVFEGTQIGSVDDYLQLQHDNSKGIFVSVIQTDNNIKYFEYTNADLDSGNNFEYLTTALSSSDSYWLVQAFCLQDQYKTLKPDFLKWISSIKFK